MIKNSPARSAPHPRTTRVDTRFRHHTARPPLSLGHIGACPPPSASAHAPRPAVPSADNVTTFLPRGWGWSSGLLNSQSICFTSYATSSLTGHTLIGIKIYLNFPHKVPTHSRTVGPAQPYKRVSKCYFLYGSGPRGCKLLLQSCPTVTLWTVAHQAPLSIRFSRQEYWGGFLCPPPGGSSRPRDQTHISYVSCTGRQVLCHECHVGSSPRGWETTIPFPVPCTKDGTMTGNWRHQLTLSVYYVLATLNTPVTNLLNPYRSSKR